MIKYRSVHNDELLAYLHGKLQKRVDRIEGTKAKFEKIDSIGGGYSENLTLGTDENIGTVLKTSVIPAVPLAIGVGALAVGLITLFPTIAPEPNMTQSQLEVLEQCKNAGESILNFSGSAFGVGIKLAAIPATVAVLSIPKKVARVLSDKYDKKTYSKLMDGKNIVEMIDLVVADSDDQSVQFQKNFLYKVDLSQNSEDFNLELLANLAYMRYCYLKEQAGEYKDGEYNEAFENFITFLEDGKRKMFGVSKKFKENKLVNQLIDEFYEEKHPKYKDEYYPIGSVTK